MVQKFDVTERLTRTSAEERSHVTSAFTAALLPEATTAFCLTLSATTCSREHIGLLAVDVWPRSATAHVNQMQKVDKGPGRTGCCQIKHTFDQVWTVSPLLVLTKVSLLLQIQTMDIISSFDSLWSFQVTCEANHVASSTLTPIWVKAFIITQPTPLTHSKTTTKKF